MSADLCIAQPIYRSDISEPPSIRDLESNCVFCGLSEVLENPQTLTAIFDQSLNQREQATQTPFNTVAYVYIKFLSEKHLKLSLQILSGSTKNIWYDSNCTFRVASYCVDRGMNVNGEHARTRCLQDGKIAALLHPPPKSLQASTIPLQAASGPAVCLDVRTGSHQSGIQIGSQKGFWQLQFTFDTARLERTVFI